jgi:hypothetical protein
MIESKDDLIGGVAFDDGVSVAILLGGNPEERIAALKKQKKIRKNACIVPDHLWHTPTPKDVRKTFGLKGK